MSKYWGKRYNTVFDRMDTLGLRFVGPQAPEGVYGNRNVDHPAAG